MMGQVEKVRKPTGVNNMSNIRLAETLAAWIILALSTAAAPSNNLDCLTCHAELADETLVMRHVAAEEAVTCTKCHGESVAHVTDGTGAVEPDLPFGRNEVEALCGECHGGHEDVEAVEAFRREWRGKRRGTGTVIGEDAVCTDCHGEHRSVESGDGSWTPLFNGMDLAGWRSEGKALWRVEKGLLVGGQGEGNAPGDLFTEGSFDDFELIVTFKVIWPANTGVWFRYQDAGTAYQADVLEYKNPVCWTGSLYCPGKMFLSKNENESLVKKDGWNIFRIRAVGNHITISLNGTQVSDVHDDSTDHGRIGFQVHPGAQFGDMQVRVREVLIRPLTP